MARCDPDLVCEADDGSDLFSGTVAVGPSSDVDRAVLAMARNERRVGRGEPGSSRLVLIGGALAAVLVLWAALGMTSLGPFRNPSEDAGELSSAPVASMRSGPGLVGGTLEREVDLLRGELLAMQDRCPEIPPHNAALRDEIENRIVRCLEDLGTVERGLRRLSSLSRD